MIPYSVHIDTAYSVVIQRIMSNFAAVKTMRNSPVSGTETQFTSKKKFIDAFLNIKK